MNDYVVLFCEIIITVVISFLFGMVFIKYYFNNKIGNNNGNYRNENGNNQSTTSQYACPPSCDEYLAEQRVQQQVQKKHQAIEELLYLRKQELEKQKQFNFKSTSQSHNDPPNMNDPSYYQQMPYAHPESEKEPSTYPTFNKNEALHSFSDDPQPSNNTESDHMFKREPSAYPTFNQKESRYSVEKEQSQYAPPESATSPNEPNKTYKWEPSNYPTYNQNESSHSFSGAPQSHSYPESQCNGANFNGESPFVEEYDESIGEWVPFS
ncbi:hypothetical protein DICPUDRAFT_153953 [Dictyostelium purpureum]|uniref:Uncharacterized protein n=1 Tax=Dictyostelium purpureum TaxID=5786 RepID=F0ZQ63_DICPU|nr:uncharacterized protein DICPUDRAFT_153953 [Dictyostelium purpureum]EGC33913.1 hypothetical protein DICPUDRAFT_153953 [Dictyostelium purpureum]|eukprot:XP_003289548.1 hypothetical protein DICPUDRAFT_153953 [Dictyostelium purpureum]